MRLVEAPYLTATLLEVTGRDRTLAARSVCRSNTIYIDINNRPSEIKNSFL